MTLATGASLPFDAELHFALGSCWREFMAGMAIETIDSHLRLVIRVGKWMREHRLDRGRPNHRSLVATDLLD